MAGVPKSARRGVGNALDRIPFQPRIPLVLAEFVGHVLVDVEDGVQRVDLLQLYATAVGEIQVELPPLQGSW